MKRLIKAFTGWRDRRFRERIDRVYFRHKGDGFRYMDGHLVLQHDRQAGRDGNVTICRMQPQDAEAIAAEASATKHL